MEKNEIIISIRADKDVCCSNSHLNVIIHSDWRSAHALEIFKFPETLSRAREKARSTHNSTVSQD